MCRMLILKVFWCLYRMCMLILICIKTLQTVLWGLCYGRLPGNLNSHVVKLLLLPQ